MSFKKPYQQSKGKTTHRSSRKAKPSATMGFLKPKRYRESKQGRSADGPSREAPPRELDT